MTHSPDADMRRLVAALHYAATHHRDQRRKDRDGSPYINHPIALLQILAVEAGVTDADVLCAAVLHDVVEDCAASDAERAEREGEIEAMFGREVLAIVRDSLPRTGSGVTDDKALPKEERKQQQIDHARQLVHGAKLVKLADKTANLRDVAHNPPASWPLERRRAYFDWARAVVEAIGPAHAGLRKLFEQASAARP
jgi:guanosine-3',5'-bis(diphosphate) 3'-pyrophosphohydrolase